MGLCGAVCAGLRLHVEPVNHVLQSGVSREEVEERRAKKREKRNGVTRLDSGPGSTDGKGPRGANI